MKKEGTGNPKYPDIALDANVSMRELYFEEASDPEVRFRGSTKRNSVWESRRENLPAEVQESVIYRNAGVRLRIASEIADGGPSMQGSTDKSRVNRVSTSSGYPERKTVEREAKSKQEEK